MADTAVVTAGRVVRGRLLARALCPCCLRVVIHAEVDGELVIADYLEWLPRGDCLSCAQTRHAWPDKRVDCRRCGGAGTVGDPRPPGRLLGLSVGEDGALRARIVEPWEDRVAGESLHEPHTCGADY